MVHEWLWKTSFIPIFFCTSQALTYSKFQSSWGVRTAVWCMTQTEQNLQPAGKQCIEKLTVLWNKISIGLNSVTKFGFRDPHSGISCKWTEKISLWASSLGRSGDRVGKGRRACNYVSGILIPPPIHLWLSSTELSDFRQSVRSGNKQKCKKTLKNTCQG